MKINLLLTIALPVLLSAGTPAATTPKTSVNPANVQEASQLLDNIRTDALDLSDDATEIQQFATDGNVDWEVHAAKLEEIKEEINDMGHKLDNLKAIQQAALPWQKQAFQRTLPLVRLLADNATAAINYVSQNPNYLFSAQYGLYHKNLAKEAKELSDMVHNYAELAKTRTKTQELQQELKPPKS